MITTHTIRTISDRVALHADRIAATTRRHDLNPYILAGLIAHESGGNPYAIRVERSFWTRYLTGITSLIRATASQLDDPWLRYPDLVAASYGLAQVLYPVAIERGLALQYPTELLDPATNLEAAARHLIHLRHQVGAAERPLLQRYNGGGNPNYATMVLAWTHTLQNDVQFPRLT
jgi:soluble lytic murein transglycosylase-like protein